MRSLLVLLLLPFTALATTLPVPEPHSQTQSQNQGQEQSQGQAQGQTATSGQAQTNAGNSLSSGDYLGLPGSASAYAPTVVHRTNCYYTPKTEGWAVWFISHSKAETKRDEDCRLHQVAEDIHPLSPALALQLHCKDPIILAGIADGSIDPKLCVFSPPAVVPRESSVSKEYVDKQIQGVKEEDKKRADALFRQSQSK